MGKIRVKVILRLNCATEIRFWTIFIDIKFDIQAFCEPAFSPEFHWNLLARGSIVLGQGSMVTIVCIPFSQPILWDVPKSFVAPRSLVYPMYFFQSQPSLLEGSRLPCGWSVLSLVYRYPTWRMSVLMSFFLRDKLKILQLANSSYK